MIFRGFFGFEFFCLIFAIKGVSGDPSRQGCVPGLFGFYRHPET